MQPLVKVILLTSLFAIPLFILWRLNLRRSARRNELAKLRYSEAERAELIKDFSLFGRLPKDLQGELEGLMHVFNAEKSYVACGGLDEVTPHMQRVIAAQACLLLLRIRHDLYGKLRTINLYPEAYIATGMHGETSVRLGESWTTGSIVLSWASVVSGGRNQEDGHQVTIHEFSHQLDQADGVGDGVPILETGAAYKEWSATMRPEFERLVKQLEKGKPTVIDSYGAENPAEFFAVSTETFYEKPEQLKEDSPEFYDLLKQYYGVDPITWL